MEEQHSKPTQTESTGLNATLRIINAPQQESHAPKSQLLEKIKIFTDLIRALAWPLLVTCLVIAYHAPLGNMLDALAEKFTEASKVSIGSLSLEIQEKAREVGSEELAQKVGDLTPRAIEVLLQTSKTGTFMLVGRGSRDGAPVYTLPKESEIKALLELESKGLIQCKEHLADFVSFFHGLNMKPTEGAPDRDSFIPQQPLSAEQEKRLFDEGYKLTDLGRQADEAVLKAVASQLQSQQPKKSNK